MVKIRYNNILLQVFSYLLLVIIASFSILPFIWMIFTSIKPSNEVFTTPPKLFAENPTISNYLRVILKTDIPRAFLNSTVVAFFTVGITLVISILSGYGLSRYKFKGMEMTSISLLFGQMLPQVVLVIPLFMIYHKIGLIDTYFVLILSNLIITVPISVLILRSFINTIPKELEEAAKIDGCSSLGALFRVIVPVITPGIIAVSVFSFLLAWDEFLFALNFITSTRLKTLPLALAALSGQHYIDWGGLMAASVIISFPVLMVFLIFNRYFIKGLFEGAIKG